MDFHEVLEKLGLDNVEWEEPLLKVGESEKGKIVVQCSHCASIWSIDNCVFIPGLTNIDFNSEYGDSLLKAWHEDGSWWKCPLGCK